MANKIQLRRGLKSAMPTGSAGEPLYATDTRELYIGTGSGNVNMGGSHWYRGTAMSGTSASANAYSYSACPQVKVDDMYLNTSNGNLYACTTAGSGSSAKWTYQGCIKGATGAAGPLGTADSALSKTSTNPVQNKAIYGMVSIMSKMAGAAALDNAEISFVAGEYSDECYIDNGDLTMDALGLARASKVGDTFIIPNLPDSPEKIKDFTRKNFYCYNLCGEQVSPINGKNTLFYVAELPSSENGNIGKIYYMQ